MNNRGSAEVSCQSFQSTHIRNGCVYCNCLRFVKRNATLEHPVGAFNRSFKRRCFTVSPASNSHETLVFTAENSNAW